MSAFYGRRVSAGDRKRTGLGERLIREGRIETDGIRGIGKKNRWKEEKIEGRKSLPVDRAGDNHRRGEWSGASGADDEAERRRSGRIIRGKKGKESVAGRKSDGSTGVEFAVSYRPVRRDANRPPRDRRTKTRPRSRIVPNLSLLRDPFRFSLYRHPGFTFGSGHDFHRRACKNRPRQPAADQRRTAER